MTTTTAETTEHAQTSVYTLPASYTVPTVQTRHGLHTQAHTHQSKCLEIGSHRLPQCTNTTNPHTHLDSHFFYVPITITLRARRRHHHLFLPSWAAHSSLRRIRTITHYISGNPRRAKARCSGACYSFLFLQLFFSPYLHSERA